MSVKVWVVRNKDGEHIFSSNEPWKVIAWIRDHVIRHHEIYDLIDTLDEFIDALKAGKCAISQESDLIEMRARIRGFRGKWREIEPVVCPAEGDAGEKSQLAPDVIAYTYGRVVEEARGVKVSEVRWQHHCGDGKIVGGNYISISGRQDE